MRGMYMAWMVVIVVLSMIAVEMRLGATCSMLLGVEAARWSTQRSHETSDYTIEMVSQSKRNHNICNLLCDVINGLHPWLWVIRISRK